MATASQKITEIKFLVFILGAFTPPPTILVPKKLTENNYMYIYVTWTNI